MQPSVVRAVHYVSHGTPVRADGTQAYASKCRAATITEVTEGSTDVGLAVFNPEGMFFQRGVPYNEGAETPGDPDCPNRQQHANPFRYCSCGWAEASHVGGTWHWPERV